MIAVGISIQHGASTVSGTASAHRRCGRGSLCKMLLFAHAGQVHLGQRTVLVQSRKLRGLQSFLSFRLFRFAAIHCNNLVERAAYRFETWPQQRHPWMTGFFHVFETANLKRATPLCNAYQCSPLEPGSNSYVRYSSWKGYRLLTRL